MKELITKEFLETLTTLARKYGWSGDYHEVANFVEWCYNEVDETAPDSLKDVEE